VRRACRRRHGPRRGVSACGSARGHSERLSEREHEAEAEGVGPASRASGHPRNNTTEWRVVTPEEGHVHHPAMCELAANSPSSPCRRLHHHWQCPSVCCWSPGPTRRTPLAAARCTAVPCPRAAAELRKGIVMSTNKHAKLLLYPIQN
jgi:hypothetical protein